MAGFFLFLAGNPAPALAQTSGNDAATFGGAEQKAQIQESIGVIGKSTADPRTIAANIINALFGFLGLIAVSLVLYAGWLWMSSGGNPEKIQHAKDILKNAGIGLLIIFSAWAIVAFIINFFFQGSGNTLDGGAGGGGRRGAGIGSLGNGIIETLYPEPNQTDVARNTGIIVTFREPIDASTICATTSKTSCLGENLAQATVRAGILAPNVRIYKTSEASNCEKDSAIASSSCHWYEAAVYSTDGKTFVFRPKNYLGSPSELIWHTVYLTDYLNKLNGEPAFRSYDSARDQSWSFEVSNKIDLTPPEVTFGETFPAPDNAADLESSTDTATSSKGSIEIKTTSLAPSQSAQVTAVTKETAPAAAAEATVSANCTDTEFKVTISDKQASLTKSVDGVMTNIGGSNKLTEDNKCLIFDVCNLNLCLTADRFKSDLAGYVTSDNAINGNQWKVEVAPASQGDWVEIGGDQYSPTTGNQDAANRLFKIEISAALTAKNLADIILAQSGAAYLATSTGSIVALESKVASTESNNITLQTGNSAKLAISSSALAGGASYVKATTIKGKQDKPMNSLVQINFSEAMNPLTLAGSSSAVGKYIKLTNASGTAANGQACSLDNDCVSFKCDTSSRKCVGDYLSGNFKVSNVYKTVEFSSDNECGVNGCGEKIYCLPAKSHIKVWLKSPDLDACTGTELNNATCSTRVPFKNCSNRPAGNVSSSTAYTTCQDISSTTKVMNYPVALPDITSINSGLMDSAFNALDGNRDSTANGPVSDYDENATIGYCSPSSAHKGLACTADNQVAFCGLGETCQGLISTEAAQHEGDDYFFTFWTSNELKIDPPRIVEFDRSTTINATNVRSSDRIISKFSEVMMSSTLTTGSREVLTSTSTKIEHKLLNAGAYSGAAVGYWGKAWPQDSNSDGEMDSTWAEIAHTEFDPNMKYWAQNGSGINDIYQNCFKPSDGPGLGGNCGATTDRPSCVDGVSELDYKH